jgi:hypothetical protein
MYTSSHIRRYIFNLTNEAIFSTREFLSFGKRAAVDKCLSRLVKRGDIIRLTRGLFKKFDGNKAPDPCIIALHKAKAFGKEIATSAIGAAKSLSLIDETEMSHQLIYAINGHSTKFHYGKTTVYLQGASARKMRLSDTTVGLVIRALSYLGKFRCNQQTIMIATRLFNRKERQELRQSANLMPSWLVDKLLHI